MTSPDINLSDHECAVMLVNLSESRTPQEILHDLGVPRIRSLEDCKKDFDPNRCRCRVGKGWGQTDNPYDLKQCRNPPQKGNDICGGHVKSKAKSSLGYYNIDFWETNPTGKWDSGCVMFTK
jgi:hypothetical protein